ncbi:MAG: sugar ABC transporter ATP-binding protein [Candidatus Excrementavichristensenella sp.]|jgi:ribose transport system ATP-binding protein
MHEYILEMQDIRKSFFGVEVLHGVSLQFKAGEVYGLVGENGAGKSTLMNIIGGVFPADSGRMLLNGEKYKPVTPRDARDARIAFIHQELNLFSNLTVAENLYIDQLPKNAIQAVDYKHMRREGGERLKSLGLDISPNALVSDLPMGIRQTVEIAKALLMNARIILFDEPTTSLSQKEKEYLFATIRALKESGVAVVYISHILEDVFELCDRVSVLRDGALIGTKERDELNKDDIVSMMVGRKLEHAYPVVEKEIGEVLLTVKDVQAPPMVKGCSLELRRGEVLGIFGLMGAGRTEFVRAVYGIDPLKGGSILFDGESIQKPAPKYCISRGIAFISEDRRGEGLLMPKPVDDNLILAKIDDIATPMMKIVPNAVVDKLTDISIQELRIRVSNKKLQMATNLSGGNQQKVVVGKWLMLEPKMLIMDEPTRGVDVGAKYEIYSLILDLAKRGSAVLCISSEMEELMGICDRILIMANGRFTGEVHKGSFDPKTIMNYALQGGEENG